MPYKLVVSDKVHFDVEFSFTAEDQTVEVGFRVEATRVALPGEGSGVTVGDFLTKMAEARLLKWLSGEDGKLKCPLVDVDTGAPPASGPQALAAVYSVFPSTPGLVYSGYLSATGIKAKSGN
jgi:hypothetical protein